MAHLVLKMARLDDRLAA